MSVRCVCVQPSAATAVAAPGPCRAWPGLLPFALLAPGRWAVLPAWAAAIEGLIGFAWELTHPHSVFRLGCPC